MREIDFNIKEKTVQSEIINEISVSYSKAGSFNLVIAKVKKETRSFKKIP